jgi:hypothetical protein
VLELPSFAKPAPLPAEVVEAMENIRDGIEYAGGQLGWHDYEGLTTSFAVIKAALSKGAEWEKKYAAQRTGQMEVNPIRVTREGIRKRADAFGCLGVADVIGLLRELGIVVEVKP